HLGAGGEVVALALDELSNILNGRPPVEAMPALLRLLDEGGEHAEDAAALLARMGAPAVPELALRLKGGKTQHAAAARGLELLREGAVTACAALIEALHSGDVQGKQNAISALGNIGPAGRCAVPELRRLARGISGRLRAAAAEALGKVGATEALPDLRT